MVSSYTVGYEGSDHNTAAIKKKKGVSGSTLKIIAIVAMLMDHIGAMVLGRMLSQADMLNIMSSTDVTVLLEWMKEYGVLFYVYTVLRMVIGRVAFPIFCFLLVEGFQKTRDVKKYIFRLGIFALVSEIPFDLALTGNLFDFAYQNVFFTLFLGVVVLAIMNQIQKLNIHKVVKVILSVIAVIAGAGIADVLNTDYYAMGVVFIVTLYLFRNHSVWRFFAGALVLLGGGILVGIGLSELAGLIAFAFICFYNGERGLKLKYVFYLFYPVHLLVLYLLAVLMGMGNISAM